MDLLDLPPELLGIILSFLPEKDACMLRASCKTFKGIYDQDPFYQKIVNTYGSMIGLWQSLGNTFYGGLFKLSFCDSARKIELVTLIPDQDIRNEIQKSKLISISLNSANEVMILDKFGKPAEIKVHQAGVTNADEYEDDNDANVLQVKVSSDCSFSTFNLVTISRYSTLTLPVLTRVLTRDWVTKYHGGHVSGSPQLASITPGLFKAVYGGHGVELVHVQDGQGVKVTGDPDVPFNEISFRVTCGQNVSFPMEVQSDSMKLKEVTEKYFHRYTLPNNTEIPNSFDFVIPDSMHRRDEVPKSLTKCLGRWVGEAQLSTHVFAGDRSHVYTPANLILFNDNMFATMLLDPYLVRMYYRVNI